MQLLVEETQHTENEAAQVRVTPQELAQATAAIEARQNAIAQHEAATIPIGEAVHQLNLEATPEELLAEVQAQRSAATQTLQTGVKRSTRPKSFKIMAGVIAFQAILMALLGLRLVVANQMVESLWHTEVYDEAHIRAMNTTLRNQQAMTVPTPHPINLQMLHSDKFRTLDIATDQTIQCKYSVIETLLNNTDYAHIYTAKNPTGTTWELVRAGGKFDVKCWTTLEDAQRLLNGQSGVVYATKAGAFDEHPDMQIQIPVEEFKGGFIHATTDSPSGIVINGTH